MLIHNPIGIDNNIRKNLFTDQHPDHTAPCRRKKCISQILGHDGRLTVPKRFHSSDLNPLLFYHTRHTCQADKRRHQKENHREYSSDRTHTVCVFTVPVMLRQGTAVIDIPFGFFYIFQFCLCIGNLLLTVGNLLFRPLLSLLILPFCILQLHFILCNFRFSAF